MESQMVRQESKIGILTFFILHLEGTNGDGYLQLGLSAYITFLFLLGRYAKHCMIRILKPTSGFFLKQYEYVFVKCIV